MVILRQGLAVIPDFADAETFELLRNEAMCRLSGDRVHIPGHKRGSTIAYAEIRNSYPEIARFYQCGTMVRRISEIASASVVPTPMRDQSSCSVLIYDRPGDRIGWHFDHNFYRGRHFTALLSLVNEHVSKRVSSAELRVKKSGGDVAIPTPPNTLVLFEGALVRHCVTPLRSWEKRVILSMTFCTDPTTTPFRDLQRRFKDIAYLGVRALWA